MWSDIRRGRKEWGSCAYKWAPSRTFKTQKLSMNECAWTIPAGGFFQQTCLKAGAIEFRWDNIRRRPRRNKPQRGLTSCIASNHLLSGMTIAKAARIMPA